MALPPNIRIQTPVPFPATVTGSGPITVNKQNGIWTLGYNVSNLGVQNPPPAGNLATDYVTVWDSVNQTFVNVPLSLFTGGPTLLNTLVANNSATLQDLTSFALGFHEYILVFENIVPTTGAGSLELQVHSAGGFRLAGYVNTAGGLATAIDLLQAATLFNTQPGFSGSVTMYGSPAAISIRQWRGVGVFNTSATAAAVANCAGYWNTASALNGFQVLSSAGTIFSGTIKVYGFN